MDHQVIERGKMMMRSVLQTRGIFDLEDLLELKDHALVRQLGTLVGVWIGPGSLYRGMGSGAVDITAVENIFDKLQISKESLGWSSIEINGPAETNIPGTLEKIGAIIQSVEGNAIRSFHTTREDQSFYMKLVIEGVGDDGKQKIKTDLERLGLRVAMV